MRKRFCFLAFGLMTLSLGWAQEQTPDIVEEPQQTPLQSCASCHGLQGGESVDPTIPKLAGQHQNYLEQQLAHFALGEQGPRYNPIMAGFAADLSDAEQQELSAHYASQDPVYQSTPHQDFLLQGERLYRGGHREQKVMACSSCHQAVAQGYEPAKVPALAGQYSEYLAEQLRQYRDGRRYHAMMTPLAQRLTDEQIEAVSAYLQGVQPR